MSQRRRRGLRVISVAALLLLVLACSCCGGILSVRAATRANSALVANDAAVGAPSQAKPSAAASAFGRATNLAVPVAPQPQPVSPSSPATRLGRKSPAGNLDAVGTRARPAAAKPTRAAPPLPSARRKQPPLPVDASAASFPHTSATGREATRFSTQTPLTATGAPAALASATAAANTGSVSPLATAIPTIANTPIAGPISIAVAAASTGGVASSSPSPVVAVASAPIPARATQPPSNSPPAGPSKRLSQKARSIVKDGKLKSTSKPQKNSLAVDASLARATAAASATSNVTSDESANPRATLRQKLKDKSQASMQSLAKPTARDEVAAADSADESVNPASPIPVHHRRGSHPSQSTLDVSHVEGDPDLVRGLTRTPSPIVQSASWLSHVWSPAHVALMFIVLLTLSCMRRFAGGLRRTPAEQTHSRVRKILSQFTTLHWDRRLGSGLESPMTDPRTKELAQLEFADGSRRRGKSAGVSSGLKASDVEMQSLTSSMANIHIPKMLGLENADSIGGASPMIDASVLTSDRLQLLLPYLPATSNVQDLALKYSLSRCGASVSELYRRTSKNQDALTVVADSAGHVFGCYTSAPWRLQDSYYGSAACFVFTLHPQFRVWPASGANSFFQLATRDSIALGGGDHFALWLDSSFRQGQSKSCQTFDSPSLSSEESFRCHELEVWSFVDGQW